MTGEHKQRLEQSVETTVTQSMQARQRLVAELEHFDRYLREASRQGDPPVDSGEEKVVKTGWRLPWQH